MLPYVVFSALWIYLSDRAVEALIPDASLRTVISIYKGFAFILITATLLFFLLRLETAARAKAEKARLEVELKYREIFNATTEAIFVHDAEGKIIDVNGSMLRIFGYESKAEVLPLTIASFSAESEEYSSEKALDRIRKAIQEGPQIFIWRSKRKDGALFWSEISLRSSEITGEARVLAVVRDVTERKKADEALRMSELKFETVFRGTPDMVIIADKESGRVTDANDQFCQCFGGRDKVVGKTSNELGFWLSHHDRDQYLSALDANGGKIANYPARVCVGSLNIRDLLISGLCLSMEGVDYILTNARDVSELRRAENALRESEARYRLIADNSDDVIWLYDLKADSFSYCSPSIKKLRGYTPEETCGRRIKDVLTSESYLKVMAKLPERIVAFETKGGDSTFISELEQPCKDGSIVQTEVISRLLADKDGRAVSILGVSRNISERKRAEQSLHNFRTWLERAEHVGRIGGWAINLATRKVWASPEAQRIYGLPPATEYDLSLVQDIPMAEYRPVLDQAMRNLVEKGIPYDLEFRILRGSDSTIIDVHSVAEYDAVTKNLFGVIQDITSRKGVEEKIHELAALLDIANDAIYVRGLDYVVHYWNRGAERLYGWAREEVVESQAHNLFARDRATSDAIQAAVLQHGSWSGERKQFTKNGQTLVVFSRLTLVNDAKGQPKAIMAINTDITEKKALESQFLRAQRLESLGALSSGIAHDLNNVLAPILLSTSLLRNEIRSNTGLEVLNTVESSAKRGAEVVKQVLTFARGAQGEHTVLQSSQLVGEATKIIRETFPKNIRIRMNAVNVLWPIFGDSTQVHQALMNLCVNARDAMPEGGALEIGAENIDADETFVRKAGGQGAGPYVCLYVSDTGTGIPNEIVEKIFEPFFTTKPTGQGTGLGLSTVLGILKGHKGFVRVQTELGKGTRIELFFPAKPASKADTSAENIAVKIPEGSGETVLIVDDESSVRTVARKVLERSGYRVIEAADGTEAVGMFVQNRAATAVILTDLMMPGMDGPTLVRIIRRVSPDIPIVCMSGVGEANQAKGLDSRVIKDFITKPFSNDKLLSAIAAAIGKVT